MILVLEEEVRDLKLCLTSADKELLEMKNEMSNSKTQWDNLQAELYKKVDCTLSGALVYCIVNIYVLRLMSWSRVLVLSQLNISEYWRVIKRCR